MFGTRSYSYDSICWREGADFLDEACCSGNETNLLQYNHDGIGQHNCYHLDDMGVSCGKRLFSLF